MSEFVPPHSLNHPPGRCSQCDIERADWRRKQQRANPPPAKAGQYIFRSTLTSNFTVIPNALLQDDALSFKARGMLVRMLSNREDWVVYAGWLEKQTPGEGREAIAGGMKELEGAGYIVFAAASRDEKGRLNGGSWLVYDDPVPENEKTNQTKWREFLKKSQLAILPGYGKPGAGSSPANGSPPSGLPCSGKPGPNKNDGTKETSTKEPQKEEGASSAPPDLFGATPAPKLAPPDKLPTFPEATIVRVWNESVPGAKIQALAGERHRLTGARWKQLGSNLDNWRAFCQRVGNSPFLTGQETSKSKRTFTADFDWAILPGNFLKIQEGKYDPKSKSKPDSQKYEF